MTMETFHLSLICNFLLQEIQKVDIPARDHVAQSLQDFILKEMDKRFQDAEFNSLWAIATMLDPRFLKVHFKKDQAVSEALALMESKIIEDLAKEVPAASTTPEPSPEPVQSEPNAPKNLWDSHDKIVEKTSSIRNTLDDFTNVARQEIKSFFSRKVTPRSSNPLALWNEELKFLYPNLHKLAQVHLPTIATSTPSERQFSLAGRIMGEQSSRLTKEHLSQRIFLATCEKDKWNL